VRSAASGLALATPEQDRGRLAEGPPKLAASSEWPEVKITSDGDDVANHSGGRGLGPNRNDDHARRVPCDHDRGRP
jgi:hypothetical protein